MNDELNDKRNLRKTRAGTVVSDCQDKTLVVKIERHATHARYHKVVTKSKKYYVHDENNEARVGDVVDIMETRPLSKLKRWRLVNIVSRAATD